MTKKQIEQKMLRCSTLSQHNAERGHYRRAWYWADQLRHYALLRLRRFTSAARDARKNSRAASGLSRAN